MSAKLHVFFALILFSDASLMQFVYKFNTASAESFFTGFAGGAGAPVSSSILLVFFFGAESTFSSSSFVNDRLNSSVVSRESNDFCRSNVSSFGDNNPTGRGDRLSGVFLRPPLTFWLCGVSTPDISHVSRAHDDDVCGATSRAPTARDETFVPLCDA